MIFGELKNNRKLQKEGLQRKSKKKQRGLLNLLFIKVENCDMSLKHAVACYKYKGSDARLVARTIRGRAAV